MVTKELSFYVPSSHDGSRLDVCTAYLVKDCSRSRLACLIRNGSIRVNGKNKKPGYKVSKGEIIKVFPFKEWEEHQLIDAEPIPLKIIYEDNDIIVIDKEAGIVVHPSPGHYSGTLVNGILYHKHLLKDIFATTRPGIIHRLDKDTTGLIVVAKNNQALANISEQFKQRTVNKQYIAIVYGNPKNKSGVIDLPIGRHRVDRKKMSTRSPNPRLAKTFWKTLEKYDGTASLIELTIETGRTHQIRVHCKAIGHPILGDPTYKSKGHKKEFLKNRNDMTQLLNKTNRQMLHAHKIRLKHPKSKNDLEFKAELPKDMINLIEALRS